MIDIPIPDEVVEVIAIAIAGGSLMWKHALEVQRQRWRKEARAALIAGLRAWPEARVGWSDAYGTPDRLILPIPPKVEGE